MPFASCPVGGAQHARTAAAAVFSMSRFQTGFYSSVKRGRPSVYDLYISATLQSCSLQPWVWESARRISTMRRLQGRSQSNVFGFVCFFIREVMRKIMCVCVYCGLGKKESVIMLVDCRMKFKGDRFLCKFRPRGQDNGARSGHWKQSDEVKS